MSPAGKRVLIVDDDKSLLHTFSTSLKAYASDLEIVTAENGLQAVDALSAAHVDIVVTGLKMPEMDGFQLLLYMKLHFPKTPVIVMTAAAPPGITDRLKGLSTVSYLEKPINIKDLAMKIFQGIAASWQGKSAGVTLTGFLQLIAMEERSCALKVRSGDRSGILLIKDGDLIDAKTEDLSGEAAARDVAAWDDTEIKMGNYTGDRRKNIEAPLSEILADAFRSREGRAGAAGDHGKPDEEKVAGDAGPHEAKVAAETGGSGPANEAGPGGGDAAPEAPDRSSHVVPFNKEKPMATLRDLLSELSKLQGVNAVCLVGCDGFLIDSISNAKMEAELVGAIASSGFGASESIGRELGRGALEITMLEFGQGPVIISPVGKDFLLVIVAGKDASLGMLRLKIKKLGTEIEAAAEAV